MRNLITVFILLLLIIACSETSKTPDNPEPERTSPISNGTFKDSNPPDNITDPNEQLDPTKSNENNRDIAEGRNEINPTVTPSEVIGGFLEKLAANDAHAAVAYFENDNQDFADRNGGHFFDLVMDPEFAEYIEDYKDQTGGEVQLPEMILKMMDASENWRYNGIKPVLADILTPEEVPAFFDLLTTEDEIIHGSNATVKAVWDLQVLYFCYDFDLIKGDDAWYIQNFMFNWVCSNERTEGFYNIIR